MKILLAPAKQMETADDDLPYRQLPEYIEKAQVLLEHLRTLNAEQLQKMWKCSDRIAEQNMERLAVMDLRGRLSPAVFSYTGLAYQHLSPGAMTEQQLDYLEEHLRILSGFYGVLRPFDGITPYRLEMQAKVPGIGSLYDYWGGLLYREVCDEDRLIINLASKEYSDAVSPYLNGTDMITCVFGEEKDGKVIQKGTMAKMFRGEMVFWMAQNGIRKADDLKRFSAGCTFSTEHSDTHTYVYLLNQAETGEQNGRKERDR